MKEAEAEERRLQIVRRDFRALRDRAELMTTMAFSTGRLPQMKPHLLFMTALLLPLLHFRSSEGRHY